jgi:hypothetical protein
MFKTMFYKLFERRQLVEKRKTYEDNFTIGGKLTLPSGVG